MHLHKYEKYWLVFGIGSLIVFLLITGLMALNNSHETPNSQKTINPEKVEKIVDLMDKYNMGYGTVNFPRTKCANCGFEIAKTNINMMLEPGHISEYTTTVNKKGEFLVVCNEYCGMGHAEMHATLKVVDSK